MQNPQINDIGYVKAAKWCTILFIILFAITMIYLHYYEKGIKTRSTLHEITKPSLQPNL